MLQFISTLVPQAYNGLFYLALAGCMRRPSRTSLERGGLSAYLSRDLALN